VRSARRRRRCGGRHGRGPGRYLGVDARELVDGGGDAEAGDVRLEQALVQRVRRDGRLLPLPAGPPTGHATTTTTPGDKARVRGRGPNRGGVHRQRVVVVVERHRAAGPAREWEAAAGRAKDGWGRGAARSRGARR